VDENFFAGAELEEVESPSGLRGVVPVRYYDLSAIAAYFPAPADKVRQFLPSDKLKPVLLTPGTAVISLAAFEYREIADIEPYNEFGINVLVQYQPAVNIPLLPLLFPKWFSRSGMYVRHLPVTHEYARDGGVEGWGYPKFLADITFEDLGESVRSQLRAEGKDIVTLEVEKLPARSQRMDVYTYTVREGELLKTRFELQGLSAMSRSRGGASYILGDHTVADELRALSMVETAVGRMYAPQMQSMLHKPTEHLPL
jgi:hypothetical protein